MKTQILIFEFKMDVKGPCSKWTPPGGTEATWTRIAWFCPCHHPWRFADLLSSTDLPKISSPFVWIRVVIQPRQNKTEEYIKQKPGGGGWGVRVRGTEFRSPGPKSWAWQHRAKLPCCGGEGRKRGLLCSQPSQSGTSALPQRSWYEKDIQGWALASASPHPSGE